MKFFAAPAAGWTTSAFRQIIKNFYADTVFTEMVNMNSLLAKVRAYKGNFKKLNELLYFEENERPIGIQLAVSAADGIKEAVEFIEGNYDFDIIDLNLGCSVKKAAKSGYGSVLLNDLKKTESIVAALRTNIKKSKFSVKTRIGWDKNNLQTQLDIFKDYDIDFYTVHPRLGKNLFKGKADWSVFKELSAAEKEKLIVNGDINSFTSFKEAAQYGCAGVMCCRALFKRPQFLKELKEGVKINLNLQERLAVLTNILIKSAEIKGEDTAAKEIKKYGVKIFTGFKESKVLRKKITELNDFSSVEKFLKNK